jgi:tetratricopeptide (TPR) repeat protein
MKEEDWRGAAADWEAVRGLPGISPALRAATAYHLGWCKVKTHDPAAAVPLFEEAVKGDGPEATAAAVRLADLYLKGADAAKHVAAADLLAKVVRGVSTRREFRNPFVFASELRETFDLAISVLSTDAAYETAVKVLDSYAPVAAPGREREKRAEVLAAWAGSLQKQGGDFKPKATEAAAVYETLAESQSADSAKADALRRAAAMHTLAGEPAKAAATLQKATPLTLPDAERTAVWLDLAKALIAANRPEEAWPALNQAMANADPLSTATRYKLARLFADSGHTGLLALGKNLFEQVAKQEPAGTADREFHERALVELAHEFIKANNYPEADIWLRKQLHLYPKGPEAPLGRLFLGICLQQRAAASGLAPATAAQMREEAVGLFKQVIAEVDAKAAQAKKLDNRDAWLRLQAALRLLQAYQQLQKPNELLAEADPLLDRHRGTVEELIIKSLMYHAFKQKNQPGLALQTRDQMKELFDRLPRTAFVAPQGEYSHDYWKTVWFTEK